MGCKRNISKLPRSVVVIEMGQELFFGPMPPFEGVSAQRALSALGFDHRLLLRERDSVAGLELGVRLGSGLLLWG